MTSQEQRNSTIEFDRNYCVHYAPKPGMGKGDYCAIGCDASKRMNDARAAGEPNMTPCIGGHKTPNVLTLCPKWERRSMEHAEKKADAFQKAMERMAIVMPMVNAWRNKPKPAIDRREVIECPKRKGKLHLSQSSYNGHVHGHCETEGCVSWME